jgi:hypothetical protein
MWGQSKTKSILEVPPPCKRVDGDATRDLMVAYVTNSFSPAEKLDFEIHCRVCDECSTMLAIIQDLLRSPVSEEEEKTLARCAVGREAAGIAWRSWRTEAPTSNSCSHLREVA